MQDENVRVVRRLLSAFNQRNVEDVLELIDPGVEFFAPQTALSVDRNSSYQGHEGMRQYFDDVNGVWATLQVMPKEFRSKESHVVALGSIVGERDGRGVDAEVAWAWKLRDGKVVWGRFTRSPARRRDPVRLRPTPSAGLALMAGYFLETSSETRGGEMETGTAAATRSRHVRRRWRRWRLGRRASTATPALRFKRGEDWEERSYAELAEDARELALGLIDLGVDAGDRVCVLANTRPEWTMLELAIATPGAVVGADLPDQLPGGVRVGRGQLGRGRGRLRERRAAREDPRRPRASCPTCGR